MGLDWVNLETLAVALGVAYLVLAMRENSLCWYCAFFSTALYVWIFGDVRMFFAKQTLIKELYMVDIRLEGYKVEPIKTVMWAGVPLNHRGHRL